MYICHINVCIDIYMYISIIHIFFQERENIEAVSSGAILSDYQRIRVENV